MVRQTFGAVRETERLEQAGDPRGRLLVRHPVQRQRQFDVLADRERRHEIEELKDKAELAPTKRP